MKKLLVLITWHVKLIRFSYGFITPGVKFPEASKRGCLYFDLKPRRQIAWSVKAGLFVLRSPTIRNSKPWSVKTVLFHWSLFAIHPERFFEELIFSPEAKRPGDIKFSSQERARAPSFKSRCGKTGRIVNLFFCSWDSVWIHVWSILYNFRGGAFDS